MSPLLKPFLLIPVIFFAPALAAQGNARNDSTHLLGLNNRIDSLVVIREVRMLEKLYADDFVFSHGTGHIEGKKSWLDAVARSEFLKRKHDSVTVELHGKVALVKGKLSVTRRQKNETDRYHLIYVRLYRLRRNKWQLISHTTTKEWHETR